MSRAVVKARAEEALRRELEPGEHFVGGAVVRRDPPRWILLLLLLLVAGGSFVVGWGEFTGLYDAPAPLRSSTFLFLMAAFTLLPGPAYLAATDRRMVCCRLSRLRSKPGRLDFAVPLDDFHVLRAWRSKHRIVVRYQIPGRKRVRIDIAGAWLDDFAAVDRALTKSGPNRLDPPWP